MKAMVAGRTSAALPSPTLASGQLATGPFSGASPIGSESALHSGQADRLMRLEFKERALHRATCGIERAARSFAWDTRKPIRPNQGPSITRCIQQITSWSVVGRGSSGGRKSARGAHWPLPG